MNMKKLVSAVRGGLSKKSTPAAPQERDYGAIDAKRQKVRDAYNASLRRRINGRGR